MINDSRLLQLLLFLRQINATPNRSVQRKTLQWHGNNEKCYQRVINNLCYLRKFLWYLMKPKYRSSLGKYSNGSSTSQPVKSRIVLLKHDSTSKLSSNFSKKIIIIITRFLCSSPPFLLFPLPGFWVDIFVYFY